MADEEKVEGGGFEINIREGEGRGIGELSLTVRKEGGE
jgi:hypothetical protein